jgi:hypothetical protein
LVLVGGFEVVVNVMGRETAVDGIDPLQLLIDGTGGVAIDVIAAYPRIFDRFPLKSDRGDIGDKNRSS